MNSTYDDAALRALVRQYHDRVYRFGQRVCRDGDDADDAVQQAFITLARRPDVQRSATVLPWLMTVVKNACLAMLRPFVQRLSFESRAALDVADEALTPEASLERFEIVSKVHALIAALEPDLRTVLILRDIEGIPGDEAARRLGLTESAMKSRLHRARSAVRAAY